VLGQGSGQDEFFWPCGMHKPLVIKREIDKASPLLMKACASGELFSAAEVDVVENGRTVHYKMSDVIISSVSKAAAAETADGVGVTHIPEDRDDEVNVTLMWRAGTSQKWFRHGSREKE